MKKILVSCLALISIGAVASTEQRSAIELVKKYSSTVACLINKDSFQTVKTTLDYDDYYVVYWEGDLGCGGGSGTLNGQFTVVSKTRFGDLYVLPQVKQPETTLVCADKMESNGDQIKIYGIAYGPNDHQRSPNDKLQYSVKLEPYKDKFVILDKSSTPDTNVSNKCVQRVR
ncbi:TPA: hypothetical protein LNF33_002883 [Vibrio cholerae]|nr:hypothetical protein [Vibrio cholerae]